ncbi:MAG: acyltransferase family protein [Bacteroidia bacterium]
MSRSFGIDIVRTLAILVVILRHYEFIPGFNYGIYAIEFLFVVSGYLIGQILFSNFYSTEVVEVASVKRFMMRRWFRILPLYYSAIIVKFILYPKIGLNIIFYLLFLQNHFYGVSFFFETWSLAIDEWFYLGTPILLFLFMRFISSKRNAVLLYLLGIVVVINLLRIFWVYKTNIPWSGLNGNIVLHQDTLLIGVILAFIKNKYFNVFKKFDTKLCFVIASTLAIIHTLWMKEIRYPVDHIDSYFWIKGFDFSLFAFIIIAMLPYIENSVKPFSHRKFKYVNKFVVWGSKLSYALYLSHGFALSLSVYLLSFFITDKIIIGITGILFSIIISYLAYQYIEKYFLIIRDKYYPDSN